ncbi:hypothetical protein VMCG_06026 [Cytospora schulzeri]|uniref:Zn(2)-C6 fungal-type domain-containing protein n=1 Tax=Cytospora schulzeri TaxID=448051 RepID=A0A423WGL9_9PEZI|nr:hypothetical protein VMCG_06026 [Valsa malicola]
MSRHMACKVCRDREVRCDGERQCANCRRSGENCVYLPLNKPRKADLAQTIDRLQARLDQAEASIASQTHEAHPNNSVNMWNRQSNFPPSSTIDVDNQDFYLTMPPVMTSSSPKHTEGNFMNEMASPRTSVHNNYAQLQLAEDEIGTAVHGNNALSPFNDQGSGFGHNIRIPSLQEIRALQNTSTASDCSGPKETSDHQVTKADKSAMILKELMMSSSCIFTAQAEMAGVVSVVAEYLGWVRKFPNLNSHGPAPSPGGIPLPRPDCAWILELLESRVRELQGMAEARHRAAWGQTVEALEAMGGLSAQLQALDEEIQSHTARISRFFNGNYNVSVPLSEQKPPSYD